MRLVLCGAASLLLFGCGPAEDEQESKVAPPDGTSEASGADSATVNVSEIPTIDAFLAAYARVACELGEACGNERPRFGLGAQCEVQFGAWLRSFAPVEVPAIQYDATRGARCLGALGGLTCSAMGQAAALAFADCTGVYYGTGDVGAQCGSGVECGPGLLCDTRSCPGKCTVPSGEGEPCLGYACAQGLSCVGVGGANPRCQRLGAMGAACGEDLQNCELGLVCDESGGAGVCRTYEELYPEVALGQTCLRDSQCDPAAYCERSADSTTGTCAKRLPEGGACTEPSGVQCAGQQHCPLSDGASMCAPRAELGGACDDNYGCAMGDCVRNTCRFLSAIGESCAENAECYSSSCADEVCGVLQVCELAQ
jgi:hypothetical protein